MAPSRFHDTKPVMVRRQVDHRVSGNIEANIAAPLNALFRARANAQARAARRTCVESPMHNSEKTTGTQDAVCLACKAFGMFGVKNVEKHCVVSRFRQKARALRHEVPLGCFDVCEPEFGGMPQRASDHLRIDIECQYPTANCLRCSDRERSVTTPEVDGDIRHRVESKQA